MKYSTFKDLVDVKWITFDLLGLKSNAQFNEQVRGLGDWLTSRSEASIEEMAEAIAQWGDVRVCNLHMPEGRPTGDFLIKDGRYVGMMGKGFILNRRQGQCRGEYAPETEVINYPSPHA